MLGVLCCAGFAEPVNRATGLGFVASVQAGSLKLQLVWRLLAVAIRTLLLDRFFLLPFSEGIYLPMSAVNLVQ